MQTTEKQPKVRLEITIPETDWDFLYDLFEIFCDDTEIFSPDKWLSDQINTSIQSLREGVKNIASSGFVRPSYRAMIEHVEVMKEGDGSEEEK